MLRLPDEQILETLGEAANYLMREQEPLLAALNPPPGPYALFHHLGHAGERVRDVQILVVRLLEARERLSAINEELLRQRPYDWPPGTPYPEPLCRLMSESDAETQSMRIDYEGLFHFGSVMLDQWAYAMGYLAGVQAPEAFAFYDLVLRIERPDAPTALHLIREQVLGEARWLNFWMRSYRNGFVVHTDRPIQRGTVASAVGSEFKLFTPSPPGWEDDAALDAAINAMLPLAPLGLQAQDPSYWEPSWLAWHRRASRPSRARGTPTDRRSRGSHRCVYRVRQRTMLPGDTSWGRSARVFDTLRALLGLPSVAPCSGASTPRRRPGGRRCGAAFGRLQG